jgi:hypothetical protein
MLKEEYSLKMIENRVMKRMFGPKRDEMIGSLERLHNVKQHNYN